MNCIVGVAWPGSSFFEGNRTFLVAGMSDIVTDHPWAFAIGRFVLSSMLSSAAATVSILMPVGVALETIVLGVGLQALLAR